MDLTLYFGLRLACLNQNIFLNAYPKANMVTFDDPGEWEGPKLAVEVLEKYFKIVFKKLFSRKYFKK